MYRNFIRNPFDDNEYAVRMARTKYTIQIWPIYTFFVAIILIVWEIEEEKTMMPDARIRGNFFKYNNLDDGEDAGPRESHAKGV